MKRRSCPRYWVSTTVSVNNYQLLDAANLFCFEKFNNETNFSFNPTK